MPIELIVLDYAGQEYYSKYNHLLVDSSVLECLSMDKNAVFRRLYEPSLKIFETLTKTYGII